VHVDQTGQPKEIVVRSYAIQRRQGDFYAVCIDLNLAGVRPSMDEAVGELNAQITSYLTTIADMGCPRHLLYRRAPLRQRAFYHILGVVSAILNGFHHSDGPTVSPQVFQESISCPT